MPDSTPVPASSLAQELLRTALADAVRESGGPGAVALAGLGNQLVFNEAAGSAQNTPRRRPAEVDLLYDLASLTKVVATSTAILKLYEDQQLDLDQPAGELVPVPAFMRFTIRHLLTHTSGLVSGLPFYQSMNSLDNMLQAYSARPLENPPGTRFVYSDVGFMLLGKVVEAVAGDSLDAHCTRTIFAPLGMKDTMFTPPASMKPRIAPTEQCRWRGRVIHGEVHDENAWAVGGVAGHAGLFSTTADLSVFCQALMQGRVLSEGTLDEMVRPGQVVSWPWQGLGWRLDPWVSLNEGFLAARTAFGHTGWTGTSIWMDRVSGAHVVLLGNTCHPSRNARNNGEFRRKFHIAASKTLLPRQTNAHSGLDRLQQEKFEGLRGRRVALLTNHAAIDSYGRHILDVFAMAPDVNLRLLYSPEHGIRGQAEAGASVPSEDGPIPVVSLYGDRKAPSIEELKQVDAFVIDLQDIGARYYTYPYTMKACMAACASAGVPVTILDRPNPVGGTILEGPIARATGSIVCWAPIPIRHGMTIGELGIYFLRTEFSAQGLTVTVRTMDNWERFRLFDECQLPWPNPSPNIPSGETALAYVGMCLFEGTNLNEGRGTDRPFRLIGAPWLHANKVIESIDESDRAGTILESTTYHPVSIPGKAADPRYKGEKCEGIAIRIVDGRSARPFRLAVALMHAIQAEHPRKFEMTKFFDTLAGSDELRRRIESGESAGAIIDSYAASLERFDADRPKRYT